MDNSGESLVAFSDHPSGSSFPLGLTTVLYSATDSSGNTGTCRFGVTVQGELYLHSQLHDIEVEHVVRPAFVLSVLLQSTYKPFTSIGNFG